MKFRFGTNRESKVKIVSTDANDEQALPTSQVVSLSQSSTASSSPASSSSTSPGNQAPALSIQSKSESVWSLPAALISTLVVVPGQIFMVAGSAVSCGTLASSLFGLSFDRVTYHCGPQDSYTGIFVLAAVPLFWYAWHVRRRIAKFALLVVMLIAGFFLFGSFASGPSGLVIALISVLALSVFHFAGDYFSSLKRNWPKSFSVTRWLSICYVPAALLLWYEFSILDPSQTIDRVSSENVLTAAGIIATFSFLPALLTARDCKSRQFASGFGLSAIGQSPVLLTMLVYCITNAVMLIWLSLSGAASIADYYAWQAQSGMEPDFDRQTTYAEVLSKLLSSVAVWGILLFSVWSGSVLGVMWNRWRYHD